MKKHIQSCIFVLILVLTSSCSTSRTIVSKGVDLSLYDYVVFGKENNGDGTLDDIVMLTEKAIADTKLICVTQDQAKALAQEGKHIVTPIINVKSQYWDGGKTFITISFFDYSTEQRLAVIKSSGSGATVSHDQQIALDEIIDVLNETFTIIIP